MGKAKVSLKMLLIFNANPATFGLALKDASDGEKQAVIRRIDRVLNFYRRSGYQVCWMDRPTTRPLTAVSGDRFLLKEEIEHWGGGVLRSVVIADFANFHGGLTVYEEVRLARLAPPGRVSLPDVLTEAGIASFLEEERQKHGKKAA